MSVNTTTIWCWSKAVLNNLNQTSCKTKEATIKAAKKSTISYMKYRAVVTEGFPMASNKNDVAAVLIILYSSD